MSKAQTQLAIRSPQMGIIPRSMQDLQQLGQACAASGFFADAKQAAQAIIKIQAGAELGLAPVLSMTGINVIKGRITLSASLMASLIARAGYRMRIRWEDATACIITMIDPSGEELGESSFSLEDAKRAGLAGDNWRKYPRNMLYARAVSNAARWYAPEVLTGVYLPDEMEQTETPEPMAPPSQPEPPADQAIADTSTPAPIASTDTDTGAHPGEDWKRANRRIRAVASAAGVGPAEMKEVIERVYNKGSSKELSADTLRELSGRIEMPPSSDDETAIQVIAEMLSVWDGSMGQKEEEALKKGLKTPWQIILVERMLGEKSEAF